jgi:uncharacterized membrane protein
MIAWLGSARVLATLLLISLGANLFLGGMILGRASGDVTQVSQTRRSIEAMLAALPDAKRELVRREIGIAMPQVQQQFSALQKARAELAEEMIKPAPDRGALERGFAAVQTHTNSIRAELQHALMRAMPALSQGERRALVDALSRHQSGSALP